jgi:hypothetical protein
MAVNSIGETVSLTWQSLQKCDPCYKTCIPLPLLVVVPVVFLRTVTVNNSKEIQTAKPP